MMTAASLFAFQDAPVTDSQPLQILESGQASPETMPSALYFLSQGDYPRALEAVDAQTAAQVPWIKSYLEGAVKASGGLERSESDHFILFTPPGQKFLAQYALPALEAAASYFERAFAHRPKGKIRVEIYPNKEDFSAASTLSIPILETSGAIGICKFHRLMILSPQFLPLGYRWLDALAHEYGHLIINELTQTRMELWLHEGTARYFDTAWRSDPPLFFFFFQKLDLKTAQEEGRLVSFARMSPSMVYLKDQGEVSLAFSEVSHAVSTLLKTKGVRAYGGFLRSMGERGFNEAFKKAFKQTPAEFEKTWLAHLARESWSKTKGAMRDEIQFSAVSEEDFIGANAQSEVRLGDRMRLKGYIEAALMQYEKALRQEPDNAVILLKAARMNLILKESAEAERLLRLAIEKNPNYGTPYLELAGLVEPKEAVHLYLEANAINPFDPRIHAGLSEAYGKLGGDLERAFEESVLLQLK